MQRHPALRPLSHDHHHGLVEARRLRRAADGELATRREASATFLRFYSSETIGHFRQEEEELFPLLVDRSDPADELVTRALVEHQRLHALVDRLDRAVAAGDPDPALMRELGELLERHIRFEERTLFPHVEQAVPERLDGIELAAAGEAPAEPVVDLLAPRGRGPLWGTETDDLNATVLAWDAGDGAPEHVNAERDVFLLVLAGSATVTVDGAPSEVRSGEAVCVEKGRTRRIVAGPGGVRYLSVHRRRGRLQIAPAPDR
jgi:quercetin dioxygenase-like cupin family protein/hemerythrin-like domain-containing protein